MARIEVDKDEFLAAAMAAAPKEFTTAIEMEKTKVGLKVKSSQLALSLKPQKKNTSN